MSYGSVNAQISRKKRLIGVARTLAIYPRNPGAHGINQKRKRTLGFMLNLKVGSQFHSGVKRDARKMELFQGGFPVLFTHSRRMKSTSATGLSSAEIYILPLRKSFDGARTHTFCARMKEIANAEDNVSWCSAFCIDFIGQRKVWKSHMSFFMNQKCFSFIDSNL
jgi:ribosomal protein L34